jgi:hypothetical protein
MDENKGLKILSNILEWTDDEARTEFQWLKMMGAIKYDEYRDFVPGMRFLENLAGWLQQFKTPQDRREAYQLLRHRLIYVSPPEMQRLVELFYPCFIERRLIEIVAERRKVPRYRVRVDPEARRDLDRLRRRTLILGLSDGARIDILRHSTVGILSNEQFVIQTQLDPDKWKSLLDDLRTEQAPEAAFEVVFLVDDFMGTGSSYLRFDEAKKRWTGKLCKFLKSLEYARMNGIGVVAPGWQLCVHHYLMTEKARDRILTLEPEAMKSAGREVPLEQASHYTFGALIADEHRIKRESAAHATLVALTDRHYNSSIQTKHTDVGGFKHLGLGYGECGLALVLHHNTPNNSLPLLWAEAAETVGPGDAKQPEMRPLFRRRQRHS